MQQITANLRRLDYFKAEDDCGMDDNSYLCTAIRRKSPCTQLKIRKNDINRRERHTGNCALTYALAFQNRQTKKQSSCIKLMLTQWGVGLTMFDCKAFGDARKAN